jgi:endonuclease III
MSYYSQMKTKKQQSLKEKRSRLVVRELKRLYPNPLKTPLTYDSDIDLLVAVMLSAQTTDKMVNKLTTSLFRQFKTSSDYANVSLKKLEFELSSINYYRTKARNIQNTMIIITQEYGGSVPSSMIDLLKLPGVGRKTANVVLGHLFNTVEGIAVDTHVIRLSRKFELTRSSNPLEIEKDLMKLIPQKDWWDFSYKVKAYGREFSPARRGLDDPITKKLIALKLKKSRG